jgi:dTDP-4-dehydrorhamnose reductase
VYSSHGNNFVRTMMRLMKERTDVNVVNDQWGSPTYAKDIAEAVLLMIAAKRPAYGIFHFSNEGAISWFDFAAEIKHLTASGCNVHAIPTTGFPTPAKRPAYSVLGKDKIVSAFNIQLSGWKKSLETCIGELAG